MSDQETVTADRCGGTYTLIVELESARHTSVGSLGDVRFESGWYGYTGSALGPGGFARVDRHHTVAHGERDTRHWHVDYLLGLDEAILHTAVRSPGVAAECAVAAAIDADPVPGVGVSDCDCPTHLHVSSRRDALRRSVELAHRQARAGRAD